MKKTLAVIALAGSIALIGSAPAMAAQYPVTPPAAAVTTGTPAPGQTFIFTGSGLFPNEEVVVTVTPLDESAQGAGTTSVASVISVFTAPQTFSTTTDDKGAFSIPLALGEAGSYSITARGVTSGITVGPVVVKVAASLANTGGNASGNAGGGAPLANTGSGLANTGADSGLILWTLVGAGALAAGATSVVVVRRKAKSEVAA
jgi:LPXTG-motif cell wall-anchored protein